MNRNRSKGRLQSITLTAATLSLIVLAGCTGIRDKSNEAIGKATSALENSVINVAQKWEQDSKDAGLSRDITTNVRIGTATKLSLDNTVGNIKISSYDGDEIQVKTTIWFDKFAKEKSSQLILEQAEVSIVAKGDQLQLVTHPKERTNENLWKWSQRELGLSDFSIDYTIEVPEQIVSYYINNDVGMIGLHHSKGSYDIRSNVGSIELDQVYITGKSALETEAGSIMLNIAGMDEQSQIAAKTDIGNIVAVLNDDMSCTLVANNELGSIVGAEKGESAINGGGPQILLQSQIGTITVE
ncbi:hypothetical protein D3C77_381440 [compost metagenome]